MSIKKIWSLNTFAVLLVLGGIIVMIFGFLSDSGPSSGTLGDFVGGVAGSLWALAGVVLFYLALKAQIEALADQRDATKANVGALDLQREELTLQRNELEATRKVLDEQSQTLKLQQFETTFFNLLNFHRDTLNNVSTRITDDHGNEHLVYGKEALFHLLSIFRSWLKTRNQINDMTYVDSIYKNIVEAHRSELLNESRYNSWSPA